jgi:hypothetical protein
MKKLPEILLIVAAVALAIGVVVRFIVGLRFAMIPRAYGDPIFYWHGAMAFIGIAIGILLIQIRNGQQKA